jgi:hypothetical protein
MRDVLLRIAARNELGLTPGRTAETLPTKWMSMVPWVGTWHKNSGHWNPRAPKCPTVEALVRGSRPHVAIGQR